MIRRFVLCAAIVQALIVPASAHRLDEYLQATTIDVVKDHVTLHLYLTPGVEVAEVVLANIDTDSDGRISQIEQETYAGHVRDDLTLGVDGKTLPLRLVSSSFPTTEAMEGGVGEILLVYRAELPSDGTRRTLTFVNRHKKAIAVYMVNALVRGNPDIRVTRQTRSAGQAAYEMEFTERTLPQ